MTMSIEKNLPIPEQALRHIGAGEFWEAINLLERYLKASSNDAKGYNYLAIALIRTDQWHKAEKAAQKAIALDPSYEAAHANLLTIFNHLNKLEQAQQHIQIIKKLFPEGTLCTIIEAIILRRKGQYQEAIGLLESGRYPQDPMSILRANCDLGLLYDRDAQIDKAFPQFDAFNALATDIYGITKESKQPYLQELERCQTVFTKGWVNSWPLYSPPEDEKTPAFIFGFLRSGTTLLQHVLNAHPSIYASEEVPAFPKIIEHMQEVSTYPECLANIDEAQIDILRDFYFSEHKAAKGWQDCELLIDKYPLATIYAGAIHRLFPNAKLVFAVRPPCDCILSSYMHLFEMNKAMVHTHNMDDLVHLYCHLMDLWEQYQQVLPLNVHTVKYEDVVGNFTETVKACLMFLEMPWNDAVLQYDKKVRENSTVRTPSYEQVSKKIYQNARYRWERYRPHFEPYLDRLQPYIKKFGYSSD